MASLNLYRPKSAVVKRTALGRLWYKKNSPTQQGVGLPTWSTSPWTSRLRSSSSSLSWSASGERGVGFSTLLPFLLLESACGYKIEIYWTVIVTVTKILFLPPISDKTQLLKYSFRSAHTEVNRIKSNAGCWMKFYLLLLLLLVVVLLWSFLAA